MSFHAVSNGKSLAADTRTHQLDGNGQAVLSQCVVVPETILENGKQQSPAS